MQPNIVQFSETDRSAFVPIYRPPVIDRLRELATSEGFEEAEDFNVTILSPVEDISRVTEEELQAYRVALKGQEVEDIRVVNDSIWRVNKSIVVGGTIYPRESIYARVHSAQILRMLGSRMMNGFGILAPTPFLHVTLFTKGDNEYARRGIPIPSFQDSIELRPELYPPVHSE